MAKPGIKRVKIKSKKTAKKPSIAVAGPIKLKNTEHKVAKKRQRRKRSAAKAAQDRLRSLKARATTPQIASQTIKELVLDKVVNTDRLRAEKTSETKATVADSLIAIQKSITLDSRHVLNLKSPQQEVVERSGPIAPPPPPPPRLFPARARHQGVNFAEKISEQPNRWRLFSGKKKIKKQPVLGAKTKEWLVDDMAANQEVEDIFAPSNHFSFGSLVIAKTWYKSIAAFVLVAIVLVFPLQAYTYYQDLVGVKDQLYTLTDGAMHHLQEAQFAAEQLDLAGAAYEFSEARKQFIEARSQVTGLNGLASDLLMAIPQTNKKLDSGLHVLAAGEALSEAGELLSQSGATFLNEASDNYFVALQSFQGSLGVVITKLEQAQKELDQVSIASLPSEHQATIGNAAQKIPVLQQNITELNGLIGDVLVILGQDQWQRYLVVFTNNNELRGVGGFMGSFALVDIDRGELKKMEVPAGGTYDVQGQLTAQVISPEPLHLINPRWEFQDANWWPDFPSSARKMEWFYQNSWGTSTDGVIVITATMMSRLLAVLGPIPMPEYGVTVTADNFVKTTQEIIRSERDQKSKTPKQFLADLAPQIIQRLFAVKGSELRGVLETLRDGLNEKQVLLYFNNPQLEQTVSRLGWAGELKSTDGDYLAVIQSNIAGGKTDEVVEQSIEHQATVASDGSVTATVTIHRTHHGVPGSDIFTGVQNNSYVRVYVPQGSTLISATGFKKPAQRYFDEPGDELVPDEDLMVTETNHRVDPVSKTDIYEEHGKTVFGNWLQLPAGQSQTVVISYKLPFKLDFTKHSVYSLLIQKQSGTDAVGFTSVVTLPKDVTIDTVFPQTVDLTNQTVTFTTDLKTDQFLGISLE